MLIRQVYGFTLTFGLIAATAGCWHTGLDAGVSGTITLDGKPIGPGGVIFASTEAKGNPATGIIDQRGHYYMKTSGTVGLRAGHYRAAVSIRELQVNVHPGDRPPPGKLLIPEKYEQNTTSGLEYDVAPGGNTIDIALTSR